MAISPNTLLLPKFQQPISRRAVMGTGIAATALAAVPVLAAVEGDVDLLQLCKLWYETKAKLDGIYEEVERETDAIQHPSVPKELLEPLDLPGKGVVAPPYGDPWSFNELKGIVTTGKYSVGEREERGDTLTIRLTDMPVSKVTRARARKLLAIRRHYDAGHQAWSEAIRTHE